MSVELRHYETLSILNAELNEDALKDLINTATTIVTEPEGVVHKLDEWGRRRLAYPIEKRNDGFYFLLTYSTTLEAQRELARRYKLNENVMRSQTIALNNADIEKIKESIAKAALAKEEAIAREAEESAAKIAKAEAEAEVKAKEAEAKAKEAEAKAKEAEAKAKEAEAKAEEAASLDGSDTPSDTASSDAPGVKEASDLISAAAKAVPTAQAEPEATAPTEEKADTATSPSEQEGGTDA